VTTFLITTDLLKPGQDYNRLYNELARIGATRVLLSVFIADLNQTAVQVREALKSYVDSNDRIGVFPLAKNWATWNGMAKGVALLQRLLA
jgi:hypothetical protein